MPLEPMPRKKLLVVVIENDRDQARLFEIFPTTKFADKDAWILSSTDLLKVCDSGGKDGANTP